VKKHAWMAFAGLIILSSCTQRKGDYKKFTNDPLLYCNAVKQLNNVVMENNFPPIIASRNYTYANIAAYECIAAGDSNYQSLAGQIKHLPVMPGPATGKNIDFSLAALLSFTKVGNAVTFPEGSMMGYYDELKHKADSAGMSSEMLANTIAFSDTIVATIMNWSKKDNYAQTRSASKYTVIDVPGRWVPTPPAYTSALEPHWNEIRPLVLDSVNQFMPEPPLPFDVTNKNSKYYKEVIAIKNAIDSLTPEQQHIAEFWDDLGTKLNVSGHVMFVTKKFSPTGHWMNIVGIAAEKAKADFNTTVYAYTKTSIAMFDAFIECWNVKFKYNTVRPETVINKYFDRNWRPYLQTPPFPEYTCGHSTISSSAAESLTSVFGDQFAYTDTSELEFGIKNRSFTSFRQAALENNWARFYGGIHFHNSCIISTEEGRLVGDLINDRLKMKKTN
jgi:PAP2 superfamily